MCHQNGNIQNCLVYLVSEQLLSADWQSAQHQFAAALPADRSSQRKRCRQESGLSEGNPPPPASTLVSSARDPMAPNINIVLRGPTGIEQSGVPHSLDDYVSETLSNNLASQCRSGSLAASGPAPTVGRSQPSKPAVMLAAARQAAATLEQLSQRQEHQAATSVSQQAKQKFRYSYILCIPTLFSALGALMVGFVPCALWDVFTRTSCICVEQHTMVASDYPDNGNVCPKQR